MNPLFTIVPLVLSRIGFWARPEILLSPRGEFGEGALSHRALKKRVYIAFFRLLRLHRAVTWHSTAPHETEALRELWGPQIRLIERANDTLLPPQAVPPTAHQKGAMRAIFLGRIVAHKGLDVLLQSLAGVSGAVDLDVYGSREDEAYASHCEALAEQLPAHIRVSFRGAADPSDVVSVLSQHDLLLMPTAGENFGHVIAEALSASCGVVVTPLTPWTAEIDGRGGIIADRDVPTWTAVLEKLSLEDPADRYARRVAAGRTYEDWMGRPRQDHLWVMALDAAGTKL